MDDYNRGGHSKYSMKVHIIFVTKYRKKLFKLDKLADDVKQFLYDITRKYEYTIIQMETDKDHVHILLEYSPKVSVSDIVKQLKQYNTYQMWKIHGDYLSKQYWKHHILWSDGYFACSIGQVSQEIRLLKNISKIKGNGNERCVSTHLKVCGFAAVNI
jgi:putative transposase